MNLFADGVSSHMQQLSEATNGTIMNIHGLAQDFVAMQGRMEATDKALAAAQAPRPEMATMQAQIDQLSGKLTLLTQSDSNKAIASLQEQVDGLQQRAAGQEAIIQQLQQVRDDAATHFLIDGVTSLHNCRGNSA